MPVARRPADPFASDLPRWHPRRVGWKVYTAGRERVARSRYDRCEIAGKTRDDLPPAPGEQDGDAAVDWDETSVTPEQARYLLAALAATEPDDPAAATVAEIGAYRGVTTRFLAERTKRTVVAVDRYHPGWAEAEPALAAFRSRTAGLPNVTLERHTSGAAADGWTHAPPSLVFVDAQHNYVNTAFDIAVWLPLLERVGGILALHDTDEPHFAGTREAAHELADRFGLFGHVKNLTLFRVPAAAGG